MTSDPRWHFGGRYGYEIDVHFTAPVSSEVAGRLMHNVQQLVGDMETYRRIGNIPSLSRTLRDANGNVYEYGFRMGRPYAVVKPVEVVEPTQAASTPKTIPMLVWSWRPDSGSDEAVAGYELPSELLDAIDETSTAGLGYAKKMGQLFALDHGFVFDAPSALHINEAGRLGSTFVESVFSMPPMANGVSPYIVIYDNGAMYVAGVFVEMTSAFAAMVYGTQIWTATKRGSGALQVQVGTFSYAGSISYTDVVVSGAVPSNFTSLTGAFNPTTRTLELVGTVGVTTTGSNWWGTVEFTKPVSDWVGALTAFESKAAAGVRSDPIEQGCMGDITLSFDKSVAYSVDSRSGTDGTVYGATGSVTRTLTASFPEFVWRFSFDVPGDWLRIGVDFDSSGNLYELWRKQDLLDQAYIEPPSAQTFTIDNSISSSFSADGSGGWIVDWETESSWGGSVGASIGLMPDGYLRKITHKILKNGAPVAEFIGGTEFYYFSGDRKSAPAYKTTSYTFQGRLSETVLAIRTEVINSRAGFGSTGPILRESEMVDRCVYGSPGLSTIGALGCLDYLDSGVAQAVDCGIALGLPLGEAPQLGWGFGQFNYPGILTSDLAGLCSITDHVYSDSASQDVWRQEVVGSNTAVLRTNTGRGHSVSSISHRTEAVLVQTSASTSGQGSFGSATPEPSASGSGTIPLITGTGATITDARNDRTAQYLASALPFGSALSPAKFVTTAGYTAGVVQPLYNPFQLNYILSRDVPIGDAQVNFALVEADNPFDSGDFKVFLIHGNVVEDKTADVKAASGSVPNSDDYRLFLRNIV